VSGVGDEEEVLSSAKSNTTAAKTHAHTHTTEPSLDDTHKARVCAASHPTANNNATHASSDDTPQTVTQHEEANKQRGGEVGGVLDKHVVEAVATCSRPAHATKPEEDAHTGAGVSSATCATGQMRVDCLERVSSAVGVGGSAVGGEECGLKEAGDEGLDAVLRASAARDSVCVVNVSPVNLHVCMYIYLQTYIHLYSCVCMYICTYTYKYKYIHAYKHILRYIHMHTNTYIHTYTCMCVHLRTCTYADTTNQWLPLKKKSDRNGHTCFYILLAAQRLTYQGKLVYMICMYTSYIYIICIHYISHILLCHYPSKGHLLEKLVYMYVCMI